MVCVAGIQRVSVQMAMHLKLKKASRLTDCISIFYGIGKKCLQEA